MFITIAYVAGRFNTITGSDCILRSYVRVHCYIYVTMSQIFWYFCPIKKKIQHICMETFLNFKKCNDITMDTTEYNSPYRSGGEGKTEKEPGEYPLFQKCKNMCNTNKYTEKSIFCIVCFGAAMISCRVLAAAIPYLT